jgi:hypothetical protein
VTVTLSLGRETLPPVVPLWLVAPRSGTHAALVTYKAAASERVRAVAGAALAEAAGEWLGHHLHCLLPGASGGALLVPVPSSTGGRPSWRGRHPLEGLAAGALRVAASAAGDLVTLAPVLEAGPVPPQRLRPSRSGFAVAQGRALGKGEPPAVAGRDVVVLDDLFVSGARAGSAAAALADAGATVRAVVVLARFVRPDHNLATAAFWATYGPVPPSPRRCTLCPPLARAACSRPCATGTWKIAA